MFAKIVVGFDGSDTSERALRLACDLASKYASQIHLVHTPHPQSVAFALGAVPGYHSVSTMPHIEEVKEATNKMTVAAKDIAKECGQSFTEIHTKTGEPGDMIVECANTVGADLIVTGRRGLGALGAIIQGSTSLRVNHLAQCACLSVV